MQRLHLCLRQTTACQTEEGFCRLIKSRRRPSRQYTNTNYCVGRWNKKTRHAALNRWTDDWLEHAGNQTIRFKSSRYCTADGLFGLRKATLIGIPFPVNSVGVLPLDLLSTSPPQKATAIFANARQVLASFLVKEASYKKKEIFFKPYAPLVNSRKRTGRIQDFINRGDFDEAVSESIELLDLCLLGLQYYQRYDWLFLRSVVSAVWCWLIQGYLGWIVSSLIFVVENYSTLKLPQQSFPFAAVGIFGAFAVLLTVKQSPLMYYIYTAFPCYFWGLVWSKRNILHSLSLQFKGIALILGYILFLEGLVCLHLLRSFPTFTVKFWPCFFLLSASCGL